MRFSKEDAFFFAKNYKKRSKLTKNTQKSKKTNKNLYIPTIFCNFVAEFTPMPYYAADGCGFLTY